MRRKKLGFTLIELLVTIAVLAIMASIAAPSFTTLIAEKRSYISADEIVATLQFARTEAIKQVVDIKVCPTNDGVSCANTNAWESGILVVRNTDVLQVKPQFPAGVTIRTPSSIQSITFKAVGNTGSPATLTINLSEFNKIRYVCIEGSGRTYSSMDSTCQ